MSNRPATDRQKDLLHRRGVRFTEPLDFDQASDLIQTNPPLCTDRQRECLVSMGHQVPEGLTLEEASEIIALELNERADDATPKQIAFIKEKEIRFHGTLTRKSATYLIKNFCENNPRPYHDGWDYDMEDEEWYDPNDGITFDDLC